MVNQEINRTRTGLNIVQNFAGSLVVTTIGDGAFMDNYVAAFEEEGVLEQVTFLVIPDRKTPAGLFERCKHLRRRGANIVCPTLDEQDAYLARRGLADLILYDSDHRRNVGFLMAIENESDFMISIDDDNLCREGSRFFREHAVVRSESEDSEAVHSSTGWFNICDLLDLEPGNVYPRGFPYRFRMQPTETRFGPEKGPVHLNAGLWLQEPDLDAITWLANPTRATAFHGRSVLLGRDTWSPVNTQNTALHSDAIVAFYFVRMGRSVGGMRIDRYGDIFSGYFCQACVRHMGNRVRVGTPVVDHVRNKHDYLRDLTAELACIWLIEDMAEWLRQLRLEGTTYSETYLYLADAIEEAVEKFSGFIWDDAARTYFREVSDDMRAWTAAVGTLTG